MGRPGARRWKNRTPSSTPYAQQTSRPLATCRGAPLRDAARALRKLRVEAHTAPPLRPRSRLRRRSHWLASPRSASLAREKDPGLPPQIVAAAHLRFSSRTSTPRPESTFPPHPLSSKGARGKVGSSTHTRPREKCSAPLSLVASSSIGSGHHTRTARQSLKMLDSARRSGY
jgi:hypothetical protein